MQTVTEWLNVSLVKSVIISSQCNADTLCHANTIQQGGMKTTVVFNVLDAMYSDQEWHTNSVVNLVNNLRKKCILNQNKLLNLPMMN